MRNLRSASPRLETVEEPDSQEQDLSAIIGKTGPFHRIMLLYATFAMVVFSLHLLLHMIVHPGSVDHWCQLPETPPNTTLEEWRRLNIPEEPDGSLGRCLVYKEVSGEPDNQTRQTDTCVSRFFNVSVDTMSIVQQWDLVCDREWLYSAVSTTFYSGSLLGLALSGLLADRVGRKPVVCFAVVLLEVAGVSLYSVESFVLFNALRFLVAASVSALSYTNYVLLVEFVALEHRALYGTFTYCGFSVGVLLGNVIAYLIRDWRTVQLVIMIPTTLLFVGFWLLPESPRWLITTLRIQQACGAVSLILRKNRMPAKSIRSVIKRLRSRPISMLHQKGGASSPGSAGRLSPRRKAVKFERPDKSIWELLVIFVTQYQLSNTALCLSWFSCSVTYYGIAYDVSAQSASNVSQFVVAAVAPLAAYVLISRRGRRDVLAGSLIFTSVCCIVIAILPRDRIDRFLAILIAWFLINVAFTVMFLYATEIYPTTIRALGFNFGAAFGRLGFIIAPIFYGTTMMNVYGSRMVGYSVLSLSCVVSGFLATKLPETKETHLPDKIKPEHSIFDFSPMWLPGSRRPKDTHEDANADTIVGSGMHMTAVLQFANVFGGITKCGVGGSRRSGFEKPATSSAVQEQPSSSSSTKQSLVAENAKSQDNSAVSGAPTMHDAIPPQKPPAPELSEPTSKEGGRPTTHEEVEAFGSSGELLLSSLNDVVHTASEPVLAATTQASVIKEPLDNAPALLHGPPAIVDDIEKPGGRTGERDSHEPGSKSAGPCTTGQRSARLRPHSSTEAAPSSTGTTVGPAESAAIHAPDSTALVPEPGARNLPPSSDGNAIDRDIAEAASHSSSPGSHGTPTKPDSGVTSGVESPASRADMSAFGARTATPSKVSVNTLGTIYRQGPPSAVRSSLCSDAETPSHLTEETHTNDASSERKRKKHLRRKR
ncbi:solute carrier family 22 member 7-like isoform X2 [Dermacentor albipictus]|uniref:solute carrier family 22 member 7-like isoform X2 n=1 Tax=Dermacentor albipictus TaxID=60249 RepID=UPI0031FCE9E0